MQLFDSKRSNDISSEKSVYGCLNHSERLKRSASLYNKEMQLLSCSGVQEDTRRFEKIWEERTHKK